MADTGEGEVKHDRTGKVSPPVFPYAAKHQAGEKPARREELAAWITSPDNRYFASSYANRAVGLPDRRGGN